MIDRATEFAQRITDGMSRRGFLGHMGTAAAIFAAALGGVLALGSNGSGAPPKSECEIDDTCVAAYGPGWTCKGGRCRPPHEHKKKPPKK